MITSLKKIKTKQNKIKKKKKKKKDRGCPNEETHSQSIACQVNCEAATYPILHADPKCYAATYLSAHAPLFSILVIIISLSLTKILSLNLKPPI